MGRLRPVPTQSEYQKGLPYYWSFLLAFMGLLVGFGISAYSASVIPVCLGPIRIEHFNAGIISMLIGLVLIVHPKIGLLRPFGWFFLMLGIGIIADDVFYHYLQSPYDPFSYTKGCSS